MREPIIGIEGGSMALKILLIEDDADIREMLKTRIDHGTHSDIMVSEAENGLRGFNSLNRDLPDLVVTDLAMPEMNGLELMKLLEIKGSRIPVLVFTGRSEFESLASHFASVKLFSKPSEIDLLLAEIYKYT